MTNNTIHSINGHPDEGDSSSERVLVQPLETPQFKTKVGDTGGQQDDGTCEIEDSEQLSEVFGFNVASSDDSLFSDNPTQVGDYTIVHRLGEGGFGFVFLAEHPRLAIQVALKIARPSRFKGRKEAKRFVEEAQMAASLNHPGIVTVHDVNFIDGVFYIVQEYLPGGTLADRLEHQQGLEPEQIGNYLIPAAEALAAAHREGIYHRDIKPANVLFDKNDHPIIVDFGLAMRHKSRHRSEGVRVGTPQYMSPEQVRGEANRTDGRTDVWALGVILYQMLTGKRPFGGKNRDDIYERVVLHDPLPPRQLRPSVPLSLQRICLKCLEKLANDRYESASDLARDLKESIALLDQPDQRRPEEGPSALSVDQQHSESVPTVVPKFLRPYDRHDRESFLRLLPGPFDIHGLPKSIRFWKQWMESTTASPSAATGFLYGPSGSGKSSLLRAGLLPRVEKGARVVLVEATREQTEQDITTELRRIHRDMPELDSLASSIAWLRESSDPLRPTTVIVLDQFEQWLHGNEFEMASPGAVDLELVGAMRHSDGQAVKFLLVVRDDFSMALNRLCRLIEVRLVEGENFETIDRFDLRHSREVLIELGRGYGALPMSDEELTPKHNRFFDEALRMLSEGGRVVSVRLSLFAHIVRDKEWTESTLREMGGAEGIGLEFLDETFVRSGGNPKFRLLATPAIRVLSALLPEASDETARIKGRRRSRDELRGLAGVSDEIFEEIIETLDRELGLITPTDAIDVMLSNQESEWSSIMGSDTQPISRSISVRERLSGESNVTTPKDSVVGADTPEGTETSTEFSYTTDVAPQFYQLTHDFLVPTLERWLTRQKTSTRRGRWQLRLEQASELHQRKPSRKRLPSVWEHAQYRCWTNARDRTPVQKQFLKLALKNHLAQTAAAGILIFVVLLLAYRFTRDERMTKLAELWEASSPEVWSQLVADTESAGAAAIGPIVSKWQAVAEKEQSPSQLSLAYAASPHSESAEAFLRSSLEQVSPQLVPPLVSRLAINQEDFLPRVEAAADRGDASRLVRWSAIGIQADPDNLGWLLTKASDESSLSIGDELITSVTALPTVQCEAWGQAMQPAWEALWPAIESSLGRSRAESDTSSTESPHRWPDLQRANLASIAMQYSAATPKRLINLVGWADNVNREVLFDELIARFPKNELVKEASSAFVKSFLEASPVWSLKGVSIDTETRRSPIRAETAKVFRESGGAVNESGGWVLNADWEELDSICKLAESANLGLESLRPYRNGNGLRFAATWSRNFVPWTVAESPYDSVDDLLEAQDRQRSGGYRLIDFSRLDQAGDEKWYGLWIKSAGFDSVLTASNASEESDRELPENGQLFRYQAWSDSEQNPQGATLYRIQDSESELFGTSRLEVRDSRLIGNLFPGRLLSDFRATLADDRKPNRQWLNVTLPQYRRSLNSAVRAGRSSERIYRMRVSRMESWDGNTETAVLVANNWLEKNPEDVDLLFLRGMAFADGGILDQAADARDRLAKVVDPDSFWLRSLALRIATLTKDDATVQSLVDSESEVAMDGFDAYQRGCWYAMQAEWYRDRDQVAYDRACENAVQEISAGDSTVFLSYIRADKKWNAVRASSRYAAWITSDGGDRYWTALHTRDPRWETKLVRTSRPEAFFQQAASLEEQGFFPLVVDVDPATESFSPLCCGVFCKPRLAPGWWHSTSINSCLLMARLGNDDAFLDVLSGRKGPELRM
ncbi:MAG: serine/threonine-protein kinase, partial [Planctomycetota bacterium]